MNLPRLLSAIALLSALVAMPRLIDAQTIWMPVVKGNSISFEFQKPSYDSDEIGFMTSVSRLAGMFPITDDLSIAAEIPFSNYTFDEETESQFGNPYVGVTGIQSGSEFFGEFGVRIPLVPDDASFAAVFNGLATDFIERPTAFAPELLSLTATLNYRTINEGGLTIRGRFGADFWIPLDEGDGEIIVPLAIQLGYTDETTELLAGFGGRYYVTVTGADFAERLFGEFGLVGSAAFGRWRPGVSVRIPLDEGLQEVVNLVVGLSVSVVVD